MLFFFLVAGLFSLAHAEDYRLHNTATLTKQSVELHLVPPLKQYSGSTTLYFSSSSPTSSIQLHAKNLTVFAASLNTQAQTTAFAFPETNGFDIATLTLPEAVTGAFSITLHFNGNARDDKLGLYHQQVGGEAYLFTQMQAMQARTVFPALDEPGLKTVFEFTVSAPAHLQVLHNSPVLTKTVNGKEARWHFAPTKVIPTDILALAVGKFDAVEIADMPVPSHFYVVPGTQQRIQSAALLTPTLYAALDKLFTPEYPYQKLDFVAVPGFNSAGMENAGLIFLSDDIIMDIASGDAERQCEMAVLIAHEMAHNWFGNGVTMAWWNDLWLQESFSDWAAVKVVGGVLKQPLCGSMPQRAAMESDLWQMLPLVRRIQTVQDVDGYGQLVYDKGHALLRMLESLIGEANLLEAVNQLLTQHWMGTATTADVLSVFNHAYPDTSSLFTPYLTQVGFPLINIQHTDGKLTFHQSSVIGETSALWSIPVSVQFGYDEQSVVKRYWLNTASLTVDVPDNQSATVIDPDGVGYFLYQRADQQIGAESFAKRRARQQILWLDNLSTLNHVDILDAVTYSQTLLSVLAQPGLVPDVDKRIVNEFINQYIEWVPADLSEPYAKLLKKKLLPRIQQIKWQQAEQYFAGPAWLELAGVYLDEPRAISYAASHYTQALTEGKVKPSYVYPLVATAVKHGGVQVFEKVKHAIQNTQGSHQESLIDALGMVEQPALISAYYDFLLSDIGSDIDVSYRFQFPTFFPSHRAFALSYFKQHQQEIRSAISGDGLQWFAYNMMSACSLDIAQDMASTFADWHDIPGFTDKYNDVIDMITECQSRLSTDKTKFTEWIEKEVVTQ